jgi:bifunctional UDP-N-acetylglucosamine pyrophosphorylase / glucosamine-1-phosphate N-acetyltransferase
MRVTRGEPLTVICLAAGAGTRMKSRRPKMLHEIGGRSLVGHAIAAARSLAPETLVAVVGYEREAVGAHIAEVDPEAVLAVQDNYKGGTGDAAQRGLAAAPPSETGTVVVTYGDVPLLAPDTLRALVREHTDSARAVTILTAEVDDPTGYGRIVRDPDGQVRRVVEQKDASDEERAIREINSGIFAFDRSFLAEALGQLGTANAQGERYLTDVVELAGKTGGVGAMLLADVWQLEGVNDRVQLARLGAELNRRVLDRWMRDGVTVVDPASTWVDVTVRLAPDVTLRPGVQLHGSTEVGEGAEVGPDTTLTDVTVGADARVVRTHGIGARIGEGASVGPFAYLRPGTELAAGGKIGTFVETKQASIGPGAKVPHLSYVGDATIGEGTNIGAGTIFANYDGIQKQRTVIGRHCKTSSNNTFVAPVEIGDGAYTGAGTVVRRDVPPGALAVSSGPQRHIEDWVDRKRPGTAAAQAAARARAAPASDVTASQEKPASGSGEPST